MVKTILISIIVFLCTVFCLEGYPYDGSQMKAEELKDIIEKHIEQVQLKNPQKYKEMIQRAGENITYCTDCHIEVAKDKKLVPGTR